jgi:Dimerisation domain
MAKRMRAQKRQTLDPMMLMNILAGKWASQAIGVAAEFGVANLFGNGTKTASEIAKATNTSADGMYRLLRALAGIGLFVESTGQKFRLTRLGQFLRTDVSQSVGGLPGSWDMTRPSEHALE